MPRSSKWMDAIREPVPPAVRDALARAWQRLPAALRGPRQFLGRQYAGCGATVGAMPRCDFACRGCYLGGSANRTPALPLGEVVGQLRSLRRWLGPGGNVQLTDGEVTLRDPFELVSLVEAARDLELQPMLMTHGEHLRREPALLHRLMDAGLQEVSIHVDTTQRGRRDPRFRRAERESELHALRDEFARLIRQARRTTGRPLQAASTVTVTRDNLDGVAGIVRWMVENADAFKMVSFQPVAEVGRTESSLQGVRVSELWDRIHLALGDYGVRGSDLAAHQGHLGHADCSRFVQGLVRRSRGEKPRFVPLFAPDDPDQRRAIAVLLESLGGLTFRGDGPGTALARSLGVALRHGPALLRGGVPLLRDVLRRLAPEGSLRFALGWIRGRERVAYLNLVSHHFMSADELDTPKGRERLDACAFQASIDGELVPMCAVNARGIRDELYASLRGESEAPTLPVAASHRLPEAVSNRPGAAA